MNETEDLVDEFTIAFHDAVNILCSTLYSDPSFSIQLAGYGFNNCSLPIGLLTYGKSLSPQEDADYFGFLSNYGCSCYHVLKQARAVFKGQYISGDIVSDNLEDDLFYIIKTKIPNIVNLMLTSRAFGKLQSYSLSDLIQAIKKSNDDEKQTFLFSSHLANNVLRKYVRNIAIVRPRALFGIEVSLNSSVRLKQCSFEHLGEILQGVKTKFAVQCSSWPDQTQNLLTREKPSQWPSKMLVQEVMGLGAYLVPYEKYHDDDESNVCDTGHAWQYSFVRGENMLLKEMSKQGRYLYKVLLGLIEPIEQLCSINNMDLHQCFLHSLLWFCEKESFEEPESASEIQRTVITHFLQFMFEFFVKNNLPDYFMPEVNLLRSLGVKSTEKLKEVMESMVDDDDFLDEVLSDTSFTLVLKYFSKALDEASRSLFLQNVQDKVIESLSVSFSGIIKVFHQSTFCKLHQGIDLNTCMELHCKALSSIKSLNMDSKIKDWCMRLVSNSLGSLYLAKAQESMVTTSTGFLNKNVKKIATKETDFFIQKAEELLLMSNNIDLIAGRVKLANFYYVNGQLQECFDLVDEIFHVTGVCASKDGSRETSPMPNPEESFTPEYVLREVVNRNIILDVLYSDMDKYTLPGFIRKNLSLTVSQLLGGESLNVYVLDADVYAHFLHAMCFFQLGKKDEACKVLEKLENLWNKTQSDLSERRNLAYLNTIAGCYMEIGEKEKGTELLEKSCKLLPNAMRNPARFKLLAVKTEKTKQVAKRTIGVAVGIAVFATIAGVVKNKFF